MAQLTNTETTTEGKQLLERGAKDAPVKDVLWNSASLETEAQRINDPMQGTQVTVRHFFFKALPLPKGMPKPDKHQIVAHYKKLIEMSLWGDGFIVREDKPIEVHTIQKVKKISKALYHKMKDEGADFVILVLAEPRRGQAVHDYVHQAK